MGNMFRLTVVCALVACAAAIPAGPPAPYHPAPAPYHAPAPAYGKPPVYDETPKPYAFEYGVADDYSGANFKAADTADHYNGFVADVSYEGVPHYPEAKAYHPAPKPAYHPAPAPYKPAPYHA